MAKLMVEIDHKRRELLENNISLSAENATLNKQASALSATARS